MNALGAQIGHVVLAIVVGRKDICIVLQWLDIKCGVLSLDEDFVEFLQHIGAVVCSHVQERPGTLPWQRALPSNKLNGLKAYAKPEKGDVFAPPELVAHAQKLDVFVVLGFAILLADVLPVVFYKRRHE